MFLNNLRNKLGLMSYYKAGANTVNEHFNYWFDTLFECCNRFFVWNGLPFKQKEIEQRLILQGHSGVIDLSKATYNGKKYNDIVAVYGDFSTPTLYYDEFEKYCWHTPLCASTSIIDKEIVVVDNNSLRNPTIDMIYQYASMLAHAEVTLINLMINEREPNGVPVGMTTKVIEAIKQYRNGLANGKFKPIQDKSMVGLEWIQTSSSSAINPKDLLEIRQNLLHAFYEDCGIKSTKYKKGNMTDNEVEGDNPLLLINIEDMLNSRKEGVEKINNTFGLSVTVDYSEGIKKSLERKEETENDGLV